MCANGSARYAASGRMLVPAQSAQDRCHDDHFVKQFLPLLHRVACRVCSTYGLLDQEVDDVVQETFRLVFDSQITRFSPDRGSAKQYLKGLVLNAAKLISRRSSPDHSGDMATALDSAGSQIASMAEMLLDESVQRPDVRVAEMDLVRAMFEGTDPAICDSVQEHFCLDTPVKTIAARLGQSRLRLTRAIREFVASARSRFGIVWAA